MKIEFKKSIITALFMILLISSNTNTFADSNNAITISPIFTQEQGLWYPGRVESKDFYIANNDKNNISIDKLYMELKSSKDLNNGTNLDINSKQFKELAKNSTVKLNYQDTVLFEEKLDNLLSEKGIVLAKEINIKSDEKALLNMTIDMDKEMNNDAQALENIFNIGVAYKIEETNPPINPEPPVNPDGGGNNGNGGGNNGNGGTDKLPQTGGIINSASLLALGTIVIGAGGVLNKKSSEEKGGKHHE